jgi:hypothetical protein
MQIDRMGRAGINTAVTDPFFRSTVPIERAQHNVITDDYNVEDDPSQWVSRFSPIMQVNLAILDALDGVCGNQFLAGAAVAPGRYRSLGNALADDFLYVNTATGTCRQYLAVEAGLANDCGGRTPLEDTIDVTYSVLAIGALAGVTDGVPVDADGAGHSLTVFPFLAAPIPK